MSRESSKASFKDAASEKSSAKVSQKPHLNRKSPWKHLGYLLPVYLSPFLYYGGKGYYLFTVLLPLGWWALGTLPRPLVGFLPVVLLPLFQLEAVDQFAARYFCGDVLTAAALFSLALHAKSLLSVLLTRLSLSVGLSFGLHVRWLFFSVSLLAFLAGLVLSEGAAAVLFASLVDTVMRIGHEDAARIFALQTLGPARRSTSSASAEQSTVSGSSRYYSSTDVRSGSSIRGTADARSSLQQEQVEPPGPLHREEGATAGEQQRNAALDSAAAGSVLDDRKSLKRRRASISLDAGQQDRESSLALNEIEGQRRSRDVSMKDDKKRKRLPSVVFATALEEQASSSDFRHRPAKVGANRSVLPKVASDSNPATSGMPFAEQSSSMAQTGPACFLTSGDISPHRGFRRHSSKSSDSLAEDDACSMILDKEVQERVYEALRRTFLVGPTLVIISVTSTSCFQYPAWLALSAHFSITPMSLWHWTLVTFPSCVLSSAIGLLYVYVFMFKQYEYVLIPELHLRILRHMARRLKNMKPARNSELLYTVFLASYGGFYLMARMAGAEHEDAQLCVLSSMVIVTSAVTLEQRQTGKEAGATDCWGPFPWHVVLLFGAVQVISNVLEGNNTIAVSFHMSFWVHLSPLMVQIVLAVVATLLAETMNNAALSRILMPLTVNVAATTRVHPLYYAIPVAVGASTNLIMPITLPLVVLHEAAEVPLRHLLFAGVIMKTALLFTLILSMNTTGRFIFVTSPTVKAFNNTATASRHEAPNY
ncbi:uncharacterized protein [Dermacentor albipictus]|uniref:uncharacterized protein isoform X2 n=1 Tax=Dermacentor albipictus TaxID=60249 RepID=UPI0038FC0319